MRRRLTLKEKRKYLKLIAQRDGGYHCLYCKRKLTPRTLIFEHLNGDDTDNRLDNIAFSCQSCNIKKAIGDKRITNLAEAKLYDNEKKMFVGDKFPDLNKDEEEKSESSKEIEINKKSWDITEQYILDEVEKNGEIPYKETIDSCVYLCKKKTDHGSYNTIKRHIDSLASPIGSFEVTRNSKKKKIIVRRISISPA